ncbi:hypothetical protein [Altererythrobacter sp. Root672]|uniref:hypothetical protein n=1 Tax=Altererythrobacter sp. Root672 TaxID=1736584 RepID=UPI0009E7978F|nr:hypothetical protein [Altererythrobacter sp. Root672]
MKRLSILAATAAAFVMAGGTAVLAPAAAQTAQPANIGGKPNLNGIWQTLNNANDDLEPHSAKPNPLPEAGRALGALSAIQPGLGVVEGGKIPYKPEALERLNHNRANLVKHDPEAACYLPGVPRATYMPYPFQIVQGENDDILMVYEYATANRVIEMRDVEVPPIDTWMGTSYGKWDGNTLVVTTLALGPGDVKLPGGEMEEGVTWLDRAGNYLSNTSTVTERFTKVNDNLIQYSATIEDPQLYTKPWTISMPLYRRMEPNAQLLEFRCVPFSEPMLYGDLLEGQ